MKVAIIGTAYPYRGGIAAFSERLARALQQQGHEVVIYTFTLQYPDVLFPGKTQYSEDPPPSDLQIIRCINSVNPLNWRQAGRRIAADQPDLVIAKFWLPFMGPCFGTLLRQIKKNKNSRILALVHNMIPHESRPGDALFTRYFVKPVDAFLALSASVLKDIDTFDTQKPRSLSPHPLYDNFGQPLERSVALQQLGFDESHQYLLFFGLIRDYKGLDLLLEAFADERLRKEKIKLIIAGEYYSNKDKYSQLIQKHQLAPRIIEVDKFIPDAEVALYFSACDLLVQPYKTATQSGVTQIAYHFDKPMIVTDVGGLGKMCPDEVVGYTVAPEPKAIAEAILRFFKQTDREKMMANIREEKKKYSWEILTKAILQLDAKIQSAH
ncbi:MAG: glycosyltransferase [Bacteroidota bacterium]